jgi:hypothetical protein
MKEKKDEQGHQFCVEEAAQMAEMQKMQLSIQMKIKPREVA